MSAAGANGSRVGIDVGGTFTDFVLLAEDGAVVTWKEPTTPADPALSVVRGLAGLLERAGRRPADIGAVVHGTTLALNAVLQQRGGRVGLVVSEGFGDIMVLGRGGLPNSFSYKDPKRTPLVPRRHVFEIPARVRPDGSAVASPTAADVDQVAARVRAAGLEALAVLVVNSYAHPEMELALAAALAERLPGVLVTASAALWPEVREFERALVTVLNGYVQPMMDRYYRDLAERLAAAGVAAPLDIATSNGGTVSADTARKRPVETLLSGPAAGAAAATRFATERGLTHIVTVDMGGTSSDMAVTRDGVPELASETRIGDYPVIVPAIRVWAIGAGGGSVLWVDPQGLLKVGPVSAGADPGPVCYGLGGSEPTVTDCYLVLGLIDPAHFLGGRMALDRDAAAAALARLGGRIGFGGPDAATATAEAALRIATAKMATEIAKGMAERGYDPAAFTLLLYGGAGPTHAAMLAEAARIGKILIPPSPGTFCAFGAVTASPRRDFARSWRTTFGRDPDASSVFAAALAELEAEAGEWIAAENHAPGDVIRRVFADMQYPRTAVELTVPVPAEIARSADPCALAALFHAEHERLYGFRDAASPVHLTTVRLTVTGRAPPAPRRVVRPAATPDPVGRRSVLWRAKATASTVFDAATLGADARVTGPAIIEMEDSTVWVPPGWTVEADGAGALRMARDGAGTTR